MTFNIETLGCKVNTYESNAISDLLINNGYRKVEENPDITIINTCTVTNTSDNKSLKTIRHYINLYHNIIIVMGCFAQISYKKTENIEGVSIILGNKNKTKILSAIEQYKKSNKKIILIDNINKNNFEKMMLNNFDKTRAFVKIQDGCNNYCSYCIIPYARGEVCSRPSTDIIKEIKQLVKNNHKEIVLTGIHTGHYGSELTNYNFASLLKDILKIRGIERLRISSIEMNEITDEILDIIKNNNILVSHMHIPLQAGSDTILKLMNRKYNIKEFNNKINKIRKIRNDISISTDIIVGFPNETDELFNQTIAFAKKIKFSKIHVFPYSRREGTKADLMENQISEEIKHKRSRELIEVSKNLEIEYMSKFINKEIEFLPEVYKDGYLIGHSGNYLLIKCKSEFNDTNVQKYVIITSIAYPYCIAKLKND